MNYSFMGSLIGNRLVGFILVFLALGGCHHRSTPQVDTMPIPLAARGLDDASTADAISVAASRRGWSCTPSGPGKLVCSLRKHNVDGKVEITYDARSFTIRSLEGTEGYDRYNTWVRYLRNDVTKEMALLGRHKP